MKRRIVFKILCAISLIIIVNFLLDSLVPLWGNELAISQLEPDNFYLIAVQNWQHIQNGLAAIPNLIALFFGLSIIKDIIKNNKNNKKGE